MTDVSIVHNCFGVPLDQLPVTVPRGDNLTRNVNADRGFFSLPKDHYKATPRNMRNGNILLIQSDQAGIRPWCALIQEPEPNGTEVVDGEMSIKLRGAEYIFASRFTAAKDVISGSPGACVIQLISFARREGFIPVSVDVSGINRSGAPIGPLEYNGANIYEAINKIASDAGAYWWMAPIIGDDNKLLLKPVFTYQRTRIFQTALTSTGTNANLTIKRVNQTGELYNHVIVYGRSENWSEPVFYEEKNKASIGYYGNVYTKVIMALEETTIDGLTTIAKSALAAHSFPPLKIDGIVSTAPFPRVGDVCTVYLGNYGAVITARRGSVITASVDSTFYSPQDNALAVSLTEIINA